jgi:hypothetical protein
MAGVIKDSFNLREAHLDFLNRNMVGLVHDFKNHLATVNEFAGLMVDFFEIGHKRRLSWLTRFFKPDKDLNLSEKSLLKELKTFQQQANEASILVQHLGNFSDGLGISRSTFPANEALEEIHYLLLRHARSIDIELEIKTSGNGPLIESDLTGFKLAVFCNVERAMRGMKSGHKISLESHTEGDYFKIFIMYTDSHPAVAISENTYNTFHYDIIKNIGGRFEERYEGKMHIVVLNFPLSSGKM